MLNYGAAAQVRFNYDTEHLVNADLTDEQLAYATTEQAMAVDYSCADGDGIKLLNSVSLQSKVLLYINGKYEAAEGAQLRYVIKDAETGDLLESIDAVRINTFWQGIYGNVGAKQMRQKLSITLYEGDRPISQTLTWSIESYVASVRAKTNATDSELNMVNAMLTYGDSVAAYMLITGQ